MKLSQSKVDGLSCPKGEREEYRDTVTIGLTVRVSSCAKVYYIRYRTKSGKRRALKLGSAGTLSLKQAREYAAEILTEVALGGDPKEWGAEEERKGMCLGAFLEDHYYPQIAETLRSHKEVRRSLETTFAGLFDTPIPELSLQDTEKILRALKEAGNKGATLNRKLMALKTALNWGVKQGILEQNPLSRLSRRPEVDSTPKLRYLTAEEESRLYSALHVRDKALREARESHRVWCKERGVKEPEPIAGKFADHLEPMITLSLKTGIRRGALFALEWRDVDFTHRTLHVRGEICKTGKGRIIPLSETAVETLREWRPGKGLIFPSPKTGERFDNVKSAWKRILRKADIEGFRWHDMRHTFASRLVMAGVDLNVVRELMGHSDLKMTLRYAHLAPEAKSRAVELLDL